MSEITTYVWITQVGKTDHLSRFHPLDHENRNWGWLKGALQENAFLFYTNLFGETKREMQSFAYTYKLYILITSIWLWMNNFFKRQDGTVMLFYSKACVREVRIQMHIFTYTSFISQIP